MNFSEDRAVAIQAILDRYPGSARESIVDLLADLYHLVGDEEVMEEYVETAWTQYRRECSDEEN